MEKPNAAELLARIRKRRAQVQVKNPYVSEEPRKKRHTAEGAFQFEVGKFTQQADLLRTEEEFSDCLSYLPSEAPPQQEWWDKLAEETGPTSKIVHPVEIEPAFDPTNGQDAVYIRLTARERRRKRRRERSARQKDAQDRIRLGLDPPPPPKLRLATVASVFGSEFLRDPTKYEMIAREAEERRRLEHVEKNQARKLSKDDRRARREARIAEHRKQGVLTAVFVGPSNWGANERHIITYSASKFKITGAALWPSDSKALVIIEAGGPEIRTFQKLMAKIGGHEIWSGQRGYPLYQKWTAHQFPTHELSRKFLAEYGCESYLDLAEALEGSVASQPEVSK